MSEPTENQNPFSQAYALIFEALATWEPLTQLVKPTNLINLQAQGYKPRNNVAAADRPQLLLSEKRIAFNPFARNSLSIAMTAQYGLEVASGSPVIDKANLLCVLIVQAMTAKGYFLGQPIASGIEKWEMVDGQMVARDRQASRPDWTALLGINVFFNMGRQDFVDVRFT